MEPSNETAIIDQAVLHARLGHQQDALADLQVAIEEPNSPRTLYQAACVNALLPEPRRVIALAFLSRAIQRGYGSDWIDKDSDLDSIRDLPGFRAIARTVGLGKKLDKTEEEPDPVITFIDID